MRPNTIRAFATGMIVGTALTAGSVLLAGSARADDDIPPVLVRIAIQDEKAICRYLADDSSIAGVMMLLERVAAVEGLSATDTGTVVALAVWDGCPAYVPALQRFADRFAPPAVAKRTA